MDGVGSYAKCSILVIGATNRPFDLDEAALRRLTKRIYIGLPDKEARKGQITKMLSTVTHCLSENYIDGLAQNTDGYSSADIKSLMKDVAMHPLREIP